MRLVRNNQTTEQKALVGKKVFFSIGINSTTMLDSKYDLKPLLICNSTFNNIYKQRIVKEPTKIELSNKTEVFVFDNSNSDDLCKHLWKICSSLNEDELLLIDEEDLVCISIISFIRLFKDENIILCGRRYTGEEK